MEAPGGRGLGKIWGDSEECSRIFAEGEDVVKSGVVQGEGKEDERGEEGGIARNVSRGG